MDEECWGQNGQAGDLWIRSCIYVVNGVLCTVLDKLSVYLMWAWKHVKVWASLFGGTQLSNSFERKSRTATFLQHRYAFPFCTSGDLVHYC